MDRQPKHRQPGDVSTKKNRGSSQSEQQEMQNVLTATRQLEICNSHESKPREWTMSILIIIISREKEIVDNISKLIEQRFDLRSRLENALFPAHITQQHIENNSLSYRKKIRARTPAQPLWLHGTPVLYESISK
jgi:hypothetical protein